MNALAIIGCTLAGAVVGAVAGAAYGMYTDRGDMPMGVLYGFPGALVGGVIGAVVGAVVFA